MNEDYEQLKNNVREFISILEIKEESDEGRVFRPNYISSCRVLDGQRMEELLVKMKELVKENDVQESA